MDAISGSPRLAAAAYAEPAARSVGREQSVADPLPRESAALVGADSGSGQLVGAEGGRGVDGAGRP